MRTETRFVTNKIRKEPLLFAGVTFLYPSRKPKIREKLIAPFKKN
jgi:hypothetical protein